ncbi:MAG: tetratricopeptide repeat protein [Kibdelosporangium sp.]
MEFSVLGPVRGWHDERPVVLGGRQRRCVLAVLLLEAGQVVPLDRMVELVWGEHPPAAVHNALQTHLSRLRKALACDPDLTIKAHPPGYVLQVRPHQVDLHRFRGLVAEAGKAQDALRAGELLREALAQWRGRPLADVLASDSLQRLSAGLDEERLAALQQRLSIDLRLGRHAAVLGELAGLVEEYPTREGLAELWILALYRCGRQTDALAALQDIRTRMVGELGIEPGAALRSLQQCILRADPVLDLPAMPPSADRADSSVPAQLPADVAGFCGRANELAELDALLLDDSRAAVISALSGTAGVGKTALAIHWAHRVRHEFPDGQLYVDLRGYDPNQPMAAGEALAGFLVALGVTGQDIPIEEAARAGRYRTEVADRRMLIVLDNVSSVAQVRALLPGTASCVVVATSRDSLAGLVALHGATRIDLDPLPPDDATTLLRNLIGARADAVPSATSALAEQCARLPLALRVAAELAVSRPATPLTRLVEELRDGRRRLRLLDGGGDVRAAVRAVFSWSYKHLPAEAAWLFRMLGGHPGPDFDLHSVAALGRLDLDEASRLLALLVRAHVVQSGSHDRYTMHDLLRAYAMELAGANDSGTDLRAAQDRLFDYYLAATAAAVDVLYPVGRSSRPPSGVPAALLPPVDDAARLRAWLNAERRNLVAVCGYAAAHGWATHAVRLAAALYRYLESGHYTDALAIHTFALRAARGVGDRSGEAHALTDLGLVHRLLGQYDAAVEHLEQALDLHRRTADREGEARALSNLGIVEDRLGRPASAGSRLEQALAGYRQIGNKHGTAAVLTNLGGLCNGLGQYSRAAGHLTDALGLFRELGDLGGEASALCNLGETETELGQYADAAEHIEEALAHFRNMNHSYGQAIALTNLGSVRSALGRHEVAIEHLSAALTIFRDTGHRYGEASVLNGLGEALHAADRRGALTEHEVALEIAIETGDLDEQVRAHVGIARVHQRGDDLRAAREHWRQALSLNGDCPQAEEIRERLAETGPAEVR